MKNNKKTLKIFLLVFVFILIIGGFFLVYKNKSKDNINYKVYKVEKKDIKSEVSVLGKVRNVKELNFSFEQGGKLITLYKNIGDSVKEGEKLAELDNKEILLQIKQIQSSIETNNVKLNYAKDGFKNSLNDLILKIKDSYNKVNDAIRNKVNFVFIDDETDSPKLAFLVKNEQLKIDLEWERKIFTNLLNNWEKNVNILDEKSDLNFYLKEAKDNLEKAKSFLNKVILALNSLVLNENNNNQNDVFLALNNINNALVALNNSEKEYKNSLKEIDLINLLNEENKINLEIYQNRLEKTILKSTINGIVISKNVEVGEIIQPNQVIYSISGYGFEIEANIPEVDIAKIKIGMTADVFLDAYGKNKVFQAKVVKIEPKEVLIEGIATYKTILRFLDSDFKIKSGMTANINILVDKKENVLVIPVKAVFEKDNKKFVKVLEKENNQVLIKEVEIKTGLKNEEGEIEVLEGLIENQEIVI